MRVGDTWYDYNLGGDLVVIGVYPDREKREKAAWRLSDHAREHGFVGGIILTEDPYPHQTGPAATGTETTCYISVEKRDQASARAALDDE